MESKTLAKQISYLFIRMINEQEELKSYDFMSVETIKSNKVGSQNWNTNICKKKFIKCGLFNPCTLYVPGNMYA